MCKIAHEQGILWGLEVGRGLARDIRDLHIKDPKTHREALETLKTVFSIHRRNLAKEEKS